jgi:hypothetical protein
MNESPVLGLLTLCLVTCLAALAVGAVMLGGVLAAAAIASVVSECCGGGDGGLLEFHQGRQWHERRLL